jgi:hypothetical protein
MRKLKEFYDTFPRTQATADRRQLLDPYTANDADVLEAPTVLAQVEEIVDTSGTFLIGATRRGKPDEDEPVRIDVGERISTA